MLINIKTALNQSVCVCLDVPWKHHNMEVSERAQFIWAAAHDASITRKNWNTNQRGNDI